MKPNSLVKRYILSTSVWILTIINTTVFLVSRNSFWISYPGQAWLASSITEHRTFLTSEFERNLSCYGPLTCLRSGGAFLSHALVTVITFSSKTTRVNLTPDQEIFIILIVGLLWRVLCLAIFIFAVTKLFRSLKIGILIANGLVFLLSGLPLWRLGQVLVNLPLSLNSSFIDRAREAFVHMSFANLIFYDYGFLALIPITALALSRINNPRTISLWKFLITGLVIASFYEAFIPIIVLAASIYFWVEERKFYLRIFTLLVGQAGWTLARAFSIRFTEPSDPYSPYHFDTSITNVLSKFRQCQNCEAATFGSLPSILVQLFLVIGLALVCGLACAGIAATLKLAPKKLLDSQNAIYSTTIATAIVVFVSFLRPITVEVGRQSLGLSIAAVLLSFTSSYRFILIVKERFRSNTGASVKR